MRFIFDSQQQKDRVIAKIKATTPEIAKDLYLNILEESPCEGDEIKPQVEEDLVDENIPQITLD